MLRPDRRSAAELYPFLTQLMAYDRAFAAWTNEIRWRVALYEFIRFGIKQGWACLFAGLMLALILTTHYLYPKDALIARYDFLVAAALAIQVMMLWPSGTLT